MQLEILGYLGGALVTISLAPQVIKSYQTKSTKDISLGYNIILTLGLALWIIYAVSNQILPLTIFASVELLLTLSLLLLKLRYK